MSFHVGQKVVCVHSGTTGVLKVGMVYTVRDIYACPCGDLSVDIGIQYQGITSCDCGRTIRRGAMWCYPQRFRPLDDLEQQLERIESEPVEEPEYA